MPIQSAVPMGQSVRVYNERNQFIFSIPLGTDPEDGIISATSSAVTVRQAGFIHTYNERGQVIRGVPVVSRSQTFQKSHSPRPAPPKAATRSGGHESGSPSGLLFILVLGALAVAVFSPGLVAVAALSSRLSLSMDTPQVWTFAIALSLAVWIALYLVSRNLRKASIRYLILCFGIVAIFLFAHFGLKTQFTEQTIRLYFPPNR